MCGKKFHAIELLNLRVMIRTHYWTQITQKWTAGPSPSPVGVWDTRMSVIAATGKIKKETKALS